MCASGSLPRDCGPEGEPVPQDPRAHYFQAGGLEEDPGFTIREDYAWDESVGSPVKPCPHAVEVREQVARYGAVEDRRQYWIVPRVVIGENEGGQCTTVMCADCVAEALATLPKKQGTGVK